MKKILLTFALITLIATANAQFVVSAHLGGNYAKGTLMQTNTEHRGPNPFTGNDTIVFRDTEDTITTPTPLSLTAGLKLGYQIHRFQFGISASYTMAHVKGEMEPDQYYAYLRESSESPFFVVNPARIPKIINWTGLYTIQQSSFTIAPYLRYELIEMGDLAFFMELNAYYTRTFEGKRHDYVDFEWLEMRNTVDSSYIVPQSGNSLGIKLVPGMSWQLNPHCFIEFYFDVLAFSYDKTTEISKHTYDSWDVITVPNVLSRREETTITKTTTTLGFDFNGTQNRFLAPNRNWVRVGINYTF